MALLNPPKTLLKSLFLAGLSGLVLTACGGGGGSDDPVPVSGTDVAVVATASSGYDSGAVELVGVDERISSGSYHPTVSDLAVAAHGSDYYLIERYQSDRIKKVALSNPGVFEWDYSTLESSDTDSANVYDLVFAAPDKAYMIRYGANTVWVVDPTASRERNFKIGELDLSAYLPANTTGSPNMSAAVIVDGKLFITLQRLDSVFQPNNPAYVAVFDTATDEEIDTGQGEDGLKGIPLIGGNPMSILHYPGLGLLVQNQGSFAMDYKGGIDVIDPDSYAVAQRLDDTEETGLIGAIEVVDADTGYYLAYYNWQNISLTRFNPGTGEVGATVAGLTGMDLRALALGPRGRLWVADASAGAPGLRVLDADSGEQIDFVATDLLPAAITFARDQ